MAFFKLNDLFAGRYLLVELMGEGGAFKVWKAKDQLVEDAMVVLQIYAPENGLDNEGVRQFRQEFSQSRQLSHPHLFGPFHFDISEGAAYLVLPFYPQGSMARLLREEGTLSEKQVALVLSQIGSALEKLHSYQPPILHQDVRPENILVAQADYYILAGWGKRAQSSYVLDYYNPGGQPNQEAYIPPESFNQFQEVTTSGDVFSLGVTLFEMCTNTLPWGGAGSHSLLTEGEVPSLPDHYSPELNSLLQACMSPESDKRPEAEELHRRGNHYLETGSWNLAESGKGEGSRIKKILAYSLASAVLVLFIAGAFLEFTNNDFAFSTEGLQKMNSSVDKDKEKEVDELLIEMLEQERESLAQRTRELEQQNRQLLRGDSTSSILMNEEVRTEKTAVNLAEKEPQVAEKEKPTAIKEQEVKELPKPKEPASTKREASSSVTPSSSPSTVVSSTKVNTASLARELEQQLNKISDPGLSPQNRKVWKEETMARFSEGGVRILDETEGTPKQYSTSIFLNLLYKVPHKIEVKEVKSDQNRKVSEIRLTMETKM